MRWNIKPYIEVYRSPRMATMAVLGFSSGLPLALTGGTLQAWMAVVGIDLRTIGIFSLVGLPYTLKFLWAPLMDRYVPPLLGRRRGWMVACQLALILGIAAMGVSSPREGIIAMGLLALLVAFSSSSQDIVIDAYRTDVLHEVERGAGTAVFVTGYRIAMLVSGALALILSDHLGWRATYLLMAGFVLVGVAGSLLAPEPATPGVPRSLKEAVQGPLQNFFGREGALSLLALIVLFKLGDAYAGTLTTAFLIRGVGFSPTEVGTVNKGLGLVSVIVGAGIGGSIMVKLGLFRSLLTFGVLQAVSNLSFSALAAVGKSYALMVFAVAFENLTGGMGTAAFVALLMALCDKRFSATQFALLSSLAALGRVFISPTSGFMVEAMGWSAFFFLTAVTAVPGIVILLLLRRQITALGQAGT